MRSLPQGGPSGGLLALPSLRPTTLVARLGLEEPRSGWEELGRKTKRKEEREGSSQRSKEGKTGKSGCTY